MLKLGINKEDTIIIKLEDGREIKINVDLRKHNLHITKFGVAFDAPKSILIKREKKIIEHSNEDCARSR